MQLFFVCSVQLFFVCSVQLFFVCSVQLLFVCSVQLFFVRSVQLFFWFAMCILAFVSSEVYTIGKFHLLIAFILFAAMSLLGHRYKGTGRFFIKTLLQKCFKTANFDRLRHSMIKE